MQNKNRNVIALIFVIVVITVGVISRLVVTKTQTPDQQAVVKPITPAIQPSQQNNIYTNAEFGFQITLPSSWSNKYKAVSSGANSISFLLPTNDKDWQDSNKTYPGYVEIYGITVWGLADWDKELLNCKKGAVLELCGDNVIGKTAQHVITWFHPQDQPTDFVQYNSDGIEYLKQNFKASID